MTFAAERREHCGVFGLDGSFYLRNLKSDARLGYNPVAARNRSSFPRLKKTKPKPPLPQGCDASVVLCPGSRLYA